MKALFIGLPLHGHTNPSLPLVRALVERGDQCTYVSTPAFRDAIEDAGGRFRPYRNAFLADLSGLPAQTDRLAWLLMRTTREVLAEELDGFKAERPDYVITDSVAPWGQWIGEMLGVPVVTSITTFAINRHVLAHAVAGGNRPEGGRQFFAKIRHLTRAMLLGRRLRREHRAKGTGLMRLAFGCSALNIVYTSRMFQPCADTFDRRFHFIGPSVGPRSGMVGVDWAEAIGAPLVYVSLGTLFNEADRFYRDCFAAFRNEPVRVVMAVGTNVTNDSLGPPPANVRIYPHVAQIAVLGHATAFVTHGGMNSVSESVLSGVPMVVVPQMSEQQVVARQVEALGAGVHVPRTLVTPERIRDSVRRILRDPTYRKAVADIRQSFLEAGGPQRGAEAIVAFTRERATSGSIAAS